MIYENEQLYFLWKPWEVATSRGMQTSFLDIMQHDGKQVRDFSLEASMWEYANEGMKCVASLGLKKVDNEHAIVTLLTTTFLRDEEYGLVNRLDTGTAGFLYFAKTREVYDMYKERQQKKHIAKHYVAVVHGNPAYLLTYGHDDYGLSIKRNTLIISYPLMHHRHENDRMVVLKEKYLVPESVKGRGKALDCETQARVVRYDETIGQSVMHVVLTRGQRHQIRAHFHALGYPLVGDGLYGRNPDWLPLHLRSVGCEIASS